MVKIIKNNISSLNLINDKEQKLLKDITRPMLQSPAINTLATSNQRSFDENGKLINEKFEISLLNKNFGLSTSKVLMILLMELTKRLPIDRDISKLTDKQINNISKIKIKPRDYADLCGIKDIKQARKDIKTAIDVLSKTTLTIKSINENKTKYKEDTIPFYKKISVEYKNENPLDRMKLLYDNLENPVETDEVEERELSSTEFYFSDVFLDYIIKESLFYFPIELLKIKGNKDYESYYIGLKLFNHYSMNANKSNKNSIKISTLLKSAPNIPTYEEVASKGRQMTKRIIEPLERSLDRLKKDGFLSGWEHRKPKKRLYTDTELEKGKISDTITEGSIFFELNKNYSDIYDFHKQKAKATKEKTTTKRTTGTKKATKTKKSDTETDNL